MAWNIHKNMRREVAQTLQEARKHARSVENTIQALEPLTDGDENTDLRYARDANQHVLTQLDSLYRRIAPSAFGQDESV